MFLLRVELIWMFLIVSRMEQIANKLDSITSGLHLMVPELFLGAALVVFLVFELISKKSYSFSKSIMFLLIGIGLLLFVGFQPEDSQIAINGMISVGSVSWIFKVILAIMLVFMGIGTLIFPKEADGEYRSILLGITLGAFVLLSSRHLLLFYVAIELMSISSYILTTFKRNKKSYEAGIKYLLFGAVSSAVMLYGISLLYGFSGSLYINDIFNSSEELFVPILLFSAGLLFKLSSFPMHIWTPSAYEGAPTLVAAFFSITPKLAVVGFIAQLFSITNVFSGQQWQITLSVIAVLTIVIGNFSALWQNDAKRMLAYSSIGHSGFLMLGLTVQNDIGLQSVIFYGVVYLFMNLAAFLLIRVFEDQGVKQIPDFAGLGRKKVFLGILMVVVMIALTGLPPTAGFTGKLLILSSFYELYIASGDQLFIYILLIAVFNAAVSLFYYLKIPYFMFFKGEEDSIKADKTISKSEIVFATFLILPLLLVFLRPEILINIINNIKLYN